VASFVSTDQIPIQGAVSHVWEPDGSSNAMIDIFIGNKFEGLLPDAIDRIVVTGPSGDLCLGKEDFHFHAALRVFWIRMPDAPQGGTYTFTVYCWLKTASLCLSNTFMEPTATRFITSSQIPKM
jgi:hypothetical protein